MPTCDLCETEYTEPEYNRFRLVWATEHYKKLFFLKFNVSVDLKDGRGFMHARLCEKCKQKLFEELIKSNEEQDS